MKLYKVKLSSDTSVWFNGNSYEGGEYYAYETPEDDFILIKGKHTFFLSKESVTSKEVAFDSELPVLKENTVGSLLSAIGAKPSVINITF